MLYTGIIVDQEGNPLQAKYARLNNFVQGGNTDGQLVGDIIDTGPAGTYSIELATIFDWMDVYVDGYKEMVFSEPCV